MVSESQERMLGGGRAEPGRGGAGDLREVADRLGRDRHRHRQRPDPGPARRRGRRRDAGRGAGRRLPALRPRAGRAGGLDLRQPRDAGGRGDAPKDELLALLASPSIASKRWAFEQYDSIVGSRTVRRPEAADAAVLQLPESGNAIAVSIDGNGRRVACDPYAGTVEAVLECAQNLACVGAEPLGLTNCLNFGNPEKPAAAWQLDRAVSGLADACKALGVPVVGGNVSLYNEGPDGPDLPDAGGRRWSASCPTRRRSPAAPSSREGDAIGLLGPFAPEPRRLGAGEAARRARRWACPPRTSPRSPPPARRSATRSAPAGSPPPTTSPTAASPAPWPSRRSPADVGCQVDLQPLRERGCSPRRRSSARAPAASCVSGERAALEELGATLLGEVGGDDDRDRRRRPQPHRQSRRRRARLALARSGLKVQGPVRFSDLIVPFADMLVAPCLGS